MATAMDMALQIHHLTYTHNRPINDGEMVDPAIMPKMWVGKTK